MTTDIYNKSIETGELQLGFWEKLTHFSIVGFMLFIPSVLIFIHLFKFFSGDLMSFQIEEIPIILVPLILAFLFYWIQKQRLKFRIVKSELNKDQLNEIILEVAKSLEWEFTSKSVNAYVAITKPAFFSGSWGEQITILFHDNCVYVNSICNPNGRTSLVSWGRNKNNEQTLINKINESTSQQTIIP